MPDCGASITVISKEFAEYLKLDIEPWTRGLLRLVGDKMTEPMGGARLIRIAVGTKALTVDIAIIEGLSPHALLGSDVSIWSHLGESGLKSRPLISRINSTGL